MADWSDIRYRNYWDLPRMVIARQAGETFLFYSRFDDELDDYIDHYEVWRLPLLTEEEFLGSWAEIENKAIERLPDIGLRNLPFEITSRNSTDIDQLKRKKSP